MLVLQETSSQDAYSVDELKFFSKKSQVNKKQICFDKNNYFCCHRKLLSNFWSVKKEKICTKTVNLFCYGGLCYIKQLFDKYFWLFVITEQHALFW